MKNHSHIYNALWNWLSQGVEGQHKTHLTTCIGMLIALFEAGSVNLTKMKAVKEELGWHYRIRLKKDCWIRTG